MPHVINLRPEEPESEWDIPSLCLQFSWDPQGHRIYKYHYGPQGTFMSICVLWIPNEISQHNGVTARLNALVARGTREESTFTMSSGQVNPMKQVKIWLRDDIENRELIDILRVEVDDHRRSLGTRRPWPENWPTFENPVGVL